MGEFLGHEHTYEEPKKLKTQATPEGPPPGEPPYKEHIYKDGNRESSPVKSEGYEVDHGNNRL